MNKELVQSWLQGANRFVLRYIHQFQQIINSTIKMTTTNNPSPNFPPSRQQTPPKSCNHKPMLQYQYFNNEYKKRSASLAEMYSAIIKETQTKITLNCPSQRKEKSLPHYGLNGKKSEMMMKDLNRPHRIQKTIDSVNQYSEHLKSTLIKQYKSHKLQSLRNRRPRIVEEPQTSPTEMQALTYVIEAQKKSDQEVKVIKVSNPRMAYKTLQLLYQTIIDNSFINRKKEAWQLQAVRLPIVDRLKDRSQIRKFQRKLRAQHPNNGHDAGSASPIKVEHSRHLKAVAHNFDSEIASMRNMQGKHRAQFLGREDSMDIIPWTIEENMFD